MYKKCRHVHLLRAILYFCRTRIRSRRAMRPCIAHEIRRPEKGKKWETINDENAKVTEDEEDGGGNDDSQ